MTKTMTAPSWQDIATFYDHLTLHIVPGPRSVYYFIPFILMTIALALPPETLSRRQIQWVVLPTVYAIQIYDWTYHQSFDVISMNGALLAFMLLGWYDVRQDFRYVRRIHSDASTMSDIGNGSLDEKDPSTVPKAQDKDSTNSKQTGPATPYVLEPYPESFSARLRWVGLLFASMRMTDWRIGVPLHDNRQPAPIKSFTTFVAETISQGLLAYILLDFTSSYMVATACETGLPISTREYFQTQAVKSLTLLAYFYAALSLSTALLPHFMSILALLAIPSLRLNSWMSPLTWPGHFGPLSSIYTRSEELPSQNRGLRAFWGIFWHQNMRFITSTPGVALVSMLGLRRGSKLRYMIVILSSFFWSGVVHMGVIPPEPIGTGVGAWRMRLRLASFFWLQVAGIGLEDMVQSAFEAGKPEDYRKVENANLHQESGKSAPPLLERLIRLLTQTLVVVWTIGFLAYTAWWTILPVACQMGWLRVRLMPVWSSKNLKA